jgi:hypothetical protein
MANPFFSPFGGTANPSGSQSPGIGTGTFSSLGAGVSDIFQGFADETKAQGDILEGQTYSEAAQLALQNEQYTKQSTAIQQAQAQRELLMSTGRTQAEVAGAGFAASVATNPHAYATPTAFYERKTSNPTYTSAYASRMKLISLMHGTSGRRVSALEIARQKPYAQFANRLLAHLRKEECNGDMSNLQIRRRGDRVEFY